MMTTPWRIRSKVKIKQTHNIFFGWYIAGVAFLAHFMSVGTGLYAINAFMQPLCQLRGWTRTDINLALVGATIAGFAAQFIYGSLLARIQIRHLMLAGILASGTAFIFLMRVELLWQFYLLYIILFLGNGAYGGIVANTAVNNWFYHKRGKALGFATAGISLSGAVIPLSAMHIILNYDIQFAAVLIGISIMLLAPLIILIVRDWPDDYGLAPDGVIPGHACQKETAETDLGQNRHFQENINRWNASSLVRTISFWKLGLAFGLLMSGAVGVMSQLKPRFADMGFSDTHAMIMLSVTALCATMGKYVWGWLCDRMTPWRVGSILAVSNAAGLSLSFSGNSFLPLFLFIIIFGFSMGGIMSVYPAVTAGIFGRFSFTGVYRFMSLFLITQLSGYVIAGQSYDRFGSYDMAYTCFIIFDLWAALLLWSVKK